MRVTLKDVIENAQKNDIKWLHNHKTRIKLIIKNEKLDEKICSYLWNEVTLRRDLVRNQKLTEDIIEYIFQNTILSKRSEVSSSVFKETLMNQEIKEDIIKQIVDGTYMKQEHACPTIHTDLWRHIPKRMIEIFGDINPLKELMDDFTIETKHMVQAIIATIEIDKTYIEEIIDKLIDMEKNNSSSYFSDALFFDCLDTLSKTVYHDDHIVDKLHEAIDKILFYKILHNLISRSNCSYLSQAKYLLSK